MVVIAPFFVLGPLVAKRDLGGAAAWAAIVAAFGIGAVVGDLAALVVRPRRPLVVGCLVVTAVAAPLTLLAVPASTAAIAAGSVFAGFGLNLFNTLFVTTMQEQVPAAVLSRVTAYDWLASVAFIPLGYAITGPLSNVVGDVQLLYAGAIFNTVAAVTLLALPSVRAVRRK